MRRTYKQFRAMGYGRRMALFLCLIVRYHENEGGLDDD